MQCPACGKELHDDAVVCIGCGRAVVPFAVSAYDPMGQSLTPEAADFAAKKIPAGICGILLGSLGVHKFILGQTTAGLIMLLVTLFTCGFGSMIMHPIGLIEGIIYLTKTDAEFYRQYGIEKKGWF